MKKYKLHVRTDMEARMVDDHMRMLGYVPNFDTVDARYPFILIGEGDVRKRLSLDKQFLSAPHELITVVDFLALKSEREFPFNPGDFVLARDHDSNRWVGVRYENCIQSVEYQFSTTCGPFKMIAPLNDKTSHLIGTNDDAPNTWTAENLVGMTL